MGIGNNNVNTEIIFNGASVLAMTKQFYNKFPKKDLENEYTKIIMDVWSTGEFPEWLNVLDIAKKNGKLKVYLCQPCIDYKSGKILQGIKYWKRLGDVLVSYINHKESKMDGSIGILERRHLNVSDFVYIGKEASNLERTGIVDNVRYETYTSNEEISEKIRFMTLKDAKKLGIPKMTYYRLRKMINEGKEVKLRKKTERRII